MSTEEMEAFALILARVLQQARSVSDSQHYDHHRWITMEMEKASARTRFWSALTEHVIKWGAISVITVMGYAAWLLLQKALKVPI